MVRERDRERERKRERAQILWTYFKFDVSISVLRTYPVHLLTVIVQTYPKFCRVLPNLHYRHTESNNLIDF